MEFSQEFLKLTSEYSIICDQKDIFDEFSYRHLVEQAYLRAMVPTKFNGLGESLKTIAHNQITLAKHNPAMALAINMHQIIVALGNFLVKKGNSQGELILKFAGADKLIAFAISEASNDLVLFNSLTKAVKVTDGYLLSGKKVFVSMASQADYYLTFALIEGSEDLVFGLVENKDIEILEDWDVLGMKATKSQSVVFDNCLLKNENVLTVVKRGPSFDPVLFGIFAHFEILLAATYLGIAYNTLNQMVAQVKERFSVANNTTYDKDPLIRYRVAEARIEVEGIDMMIDRLIDDLEYDVDYGFMWFPKLSTVKNKASEAAIKVAEQAMRSLGGRSYYNSNRLSQLYRESLAGIFQPSDQESLHNAWANILLGAK